MPANEPHSVIERRFEKIGHFVERVIAGETLLVPVTSGVADLEAIYVLNGTAAVVWERLDGSTPLAALVEAVTEAFEITPEVARRDVDDFLASLERDGLVRGIAPTSA